MRVSPLPRGAFLHTIIFPTFPLVVFHHRIPIFVNPINNGLEAFDHLTVVPGLARLRQYTGIIPRLSIIAVPPGKKQKMTTWNSISGQTFQAIIPFTDHRRIQPILLPVLLSLPSSTPRSLQKPPPFLSAANFFCPYNFFSVGPGRFPPTLHSEQAPTTAMEFATHCMAANFSCLEL
jgi:hypothetical protein